MPPEPNAHGEIEKLLQENQRLVTENNALLRKMYRNAVWSFWFKVVWSLILIGLPFVLYFYVLEPYFEAFGASIDVFVNGMKEIPGWREFYETLQKEQQ